ncbi:hypothetical protein IVB36_27375 [Bradyrhizobium sp. 35]|nr:hypothetical protein [Bradyrhizobium sp. 35]
MTVWLQVQPEHPVARSERPAQATVLPWAPALGVPAELLPQAASVRAAEPRRTAVLAAGEPGARKAVPEAAVSARAVAEPQPGAAQVASAAGGGAAGRAGAAGGAAAGGPFGGCFGFPSGPVSCGCACATTSGGAPCACDAELANCIAVRAVVASSTKRRLVMW